MYSEGKMGLRSKSFCNFHSSSSYFMLTFSLLWTALPAFGNLVPISVSFLVCSGSDPHFNPCLAVTEIHCQNVECVLVFLPAWNSLLIHFFTTFHFISPSGPLLKAGRRIVFFCFIRENVRILDFVCWTWWMDVSLLPALTCTGKLWWNG